MAVKPACTLLVLPFRTISRAGVAFYIAKALAVRPRENKDKSQSILKNAFDVKLIS